MSNKSNFIAFVAIYLVLATSGHQIVKRQSLGISDALVTATHQWTQFMNTTFNTLRTSLRSNDSESRIEQIHANLTNWRNSLTNASGNVAQDLMARLLNVTQHLNTVLRERANNDQNLVHRLYDMIINTTTNGTNHSMTTLRQAFTTAAQTMAENYSGLANHSLQLASDMRDKGSQVFNSARIRAGNDTNRAAIAVNTALNAIRNSSQPINETVQQMAANLAESVQKLSAQLRNLINETSAETQTTVQNVVPEFREKAEQSLQKLMSNMNELRTSLRHFTTNQINTNDENDNNIEDNEIDVIQSVSKALSAESQSLQDQINDLRTQNQSLSDSN